MPELWWLILPGGAIGGLVYALSNLMERCELEKRSFEFEDLAPLVLITKMSVGAGGAAAVTLLTIAIGKFPTNPWDWKEKIYLSTLSFVAGFIGHRLLPMVAARLERQVAEAKEDSKKAKEDSKKASEQATVAVTTAEESKRSLEELDRRRRLDEKIAEVSVDLTMEELRRAKGDDFTLPTAILEPHIKDLEKLRTEWPVERKLHVFLGRLYRRQRNYDQAIMVLTEFVQNKKNSNEEYDGATGAALFNIACYKALKAREMTGEAAVRLKEEAIEDLRQSCSRMPGGKQQAQADEDLSSLKELPSFQELIKS